MSPPISSHTEMVMLPVLSATLQDLTSWPSLVLVTRPISRTIKTTFKFFSPALMSFIKRGGSLTPCILRQVRLRFRDPLGKASHPRGPGTEPGGGNLGQDWRPGSGSGYSGAGETSPRSTTPKRKIKKLRGWGEKDSHKFQNQKNRKTHSAP